MDTKVVNIPFTGGINEFPDQDQLPPPELVICDNAVIRKPGRIEKRYGMTLVEGAAGVPAGAYDGDSAPAGDVEALEACYGQNGTRAVLAAGHKLYEYVGSDAAHGWRTVNRLSSYVGSLVNVTASGGSIIETETIEDNTNTYRLTVWVSGQRTGQERTSDLIYAAQTPGTGNAVYYAVQLVSTGAFVQQPTLLLMSSVTTGAIFNLRLTSVRDSSGSGMKMALAAWQQANGNTVNACVINITTGLTTAPVSVGTVGQTCHRAFDVVGMADPGRAIWAFCKPDSQSSTSPSKLPIAITSVDTVFGTIATVSSITDALIHPSSGDGFSPWATRGIVFDQAEATSGVAFAARTVSQQIIGGVGQLKVDGQIISGSVTWVSGGGGYTFYLAGQNYLPYIGFQTQDDHTKLFSTVAASPAGAHYSGAVNQSIPGNTGGTSITYSSGTIIGFSTEATLTGLVNGSVQPYKLSTFQSYYNVIAPYFGEDRPNIQASGLFPRNVHNYPANAPVAPSIPTTYQTNWITWTGTGASGFTPGVYTGCQIKTGAGGTGITLAYVTVYVDSVGHIVEMAIEDGRTTYGYGGVNASIPIGSIVGVPGGGTISGGSAHTIMPSVGVLPTFQDVPDMNSGVSITYVGANGPESCVHRWSIISTYGTTAGKFLAVSSCSANLATTPNNVDPYGAADPHGTNNFFEVYRLNLGAIGSGTLTSLVTVGSVTTNIIGALGGPWRMVSSLQVMSVSGSGVSDIGCAICPAGDEFQRNTFLVRIGSDNATIGIKYSSLDGTASSPSGYVYSGNPGMFVESCNMMRVTAIPLNTPCLRVTNRGFLTGGLRDGSAKGTQQIFSIDYVDTPQNWRKMQQFSDYTFVNGGVVSVFDGVGCNEAVPLMWPQRDLTSICWDKNPLVYSVTNANNIYNTGDYTKMPCAFWDYYADTGTGYPDAHGSFLLVNITRPYFKYEAGFNSLTGYLNGGQNILGNAWSTITTTWGGDPSKSYETVYSDPRYTQFNQIAKGKYGAGFTSAGKIPQHYYGRYHANPADYKSEANFHSLYIQYDSSLWVWAPRSAQGWDGAWLTSNGVQTWFTTKSVYNPADAGGDFLLRWVYEYVDGTGRMVRSAPSNATQYTICTQVIGSVKMDNTSSPAYMGGIVSKFKYGFFAPRLELTNRLKTATSDPRRMVLQPYTTAEPFATVLYRMPFSTFSNPASDFVIDRNVTRGVVPYVTTPMTGEDVEGYPLGYTFSNLTAFDGPTKDYNGLLAEPFLYTTGGVLDNVPPPACKAMCLHQNRLVIGGADDTTAVWFSKPITQTEGPGFNDALTLNIIDGGPVTGLASLNGNLIVFKYQDVYVVPGTFPDATGYGPSLGEPFNLPAGVGCIDHRSVVETPLGVFFRSTRGLELLTPDLDVEPITAVQDSINSFPEITSVTHYPYNREVWFICHEATVSPSMVSPKAKLLIFNYQTKTWSTSTATASNYLGRGMFATALVGSTLWLVGRSDTNYGTDQAFAYTYDQSVYYDTTRGRQKNYVKMSVVTAPISLNEVQGYQRVKRARLLANPIPASGSVEIPAVQIAVQPDYTLDLTRVQFSQWTAAQAASVFATQARAQLEVHVAGQKNQKISLAYVEGELGATPTTGFGLALSNIALTVGLKRGLDKRILAEAKH